MKISAIILAKNEEKNIKKVIDSVKFCDEVLVINDGSVDETAPITEKCGARVISRKLNGDFAAQRNFGLEQAVGEWVLFVDADEVVSGELRREIQQVMKYKRTRNVGYYIKRRDFFWGRELRFGEVRTVHETGIIRLVRRDAGKFEGKVHEVFVPTGPTARLSSYLDHYPHPTVSDFLRSINDYSTLRAKELLKRGHRFHLLEVLFYPFGKFIYTYFFRLGFLDGLPGFAYAFFMSFHSFLVRAKLYQYLKFKK